MIDGRTDHDDRHGSLCDTRAQAAEKSVQHGHWVGSGDDQYADRRGIKHETGIGLGIDPFQLKIAD
ncbi:hypothetical protein D3C84_1120050 [compost metagenome]